MPVRSSPSDSIQLDKKWKPSVESLMAGSQDKDLVASLKIKVVKDPIKW